MSEKESQFIRQLRAWIITGILGMAVTGIGFYYTAKTKIDYLEQQDRELRQQHYQDIQDIKSDIRDINKFLRDER